jgi:hypothetical protein
MNNEGALLLFPLISILFLFLFVHVLKLFFISIKSFLDLIGWDWVWNYDKNIKLKVRGLKCKTHRKYIANPKFKKKLYFDPKIYFIYLQVTEFKREKRESLKIIEKKKFFIDCHDSDNQNGRVWR